MANRNRRILMVNFGQQPQNLEENLTEEEKLANNLKKMEELLLSSPTPHRGPKIPPKLQENLQSIQNPPIPPRKPPPPPRKRMSKVHRISRNIMNVSNLNLEEETNSVEINQNLTHLIIHTNNVLLQNSKEIKDDEIIANTTEMTEDDLDDLDSLGLSLTEISDPDILSFMANDDFDEFLEAAFAEFEAEAALADEEEIGKHTVDSSTIRNRNLTNRKNINNAINNRTNTTTDKRNSKIVYAQVPTHWQNKTPQQRQLLIRKSFLLSLQQKQLNDLNNNNNNNNSSNNNNNNNNNSNTNIPSKLNTKPPPNDNKSVSNTSTPPRNPLIKNGTTPPPPPRRINKVENNAPKNGVGNAEDEDKPIPLTFVLASAPIQHANVFNSKNNNTMISNNNNNNNNNNNSNNSNNNDNDGNNSNSNSGIKNPRLNATLREKREAPILRHRSPTSPEQPSAPPFRPPPPPRTQTNPVISSNVNQHNTPNTPSNPPINSPPIIRMAGNPIKVENRKPSPSYDSSPTSSNNDNQSSGQHGTLRKNVSPQPSTQNNNNGLLSKLNILERQQRKLEMEPPGAKFRKKEKATGNSG